MHSSKEYWRRHRNKERRDHEAIHDVLIPILKVKLQGDGAVLDHLNAHPGRVRQASLSRSAEARKCYLCQEWVGAGDVAWALSARRKGVHVNKARRLLRMFVCDACARDPAKEADAEHPTAGIIEEAV